MELATAGGNIVSELDTIIARWQNVNYRYEENHAVDDPDDDEALISQVHNEVVPTEHYVESAAIVATPDQGEEIIVLDLEEPSDDERTALWLLAQAPKDIHALIHRLNTLRTFEQSVRVYEAQLSAKEAEGAALRLALTHYATRFSEGRTASDALEKTTAGKVFLRELLAARTYIDYLNGFYDDLPMGDGLGEAYWKARGESNA